MITIVPAQTGEATTACGHQCMRCGVVVSSFTVIAGQYLCGSCVLALSPVNSGGALLPPVWAQPVEMAAAHDIVAAVDRLTAAVENCTAAMLKRSA